MDASTHHANLPVRALVLDREENSILRTKYVGDAARLMRNFLPWATSLLFVCGLVQSHLYPQLFEPGAHVLHPRDWRTMVWQCIYIVNGLTILCYLFGLRALSGSPSSATTLRVITMVGYSTMLASSVLIGLSHLHPGLLLPHNLFIMIMLAMSPTSLANRLLLVLVSVAGPCVALFACGFFSVAPPQGLNLVEGGPTFNRIVEWLEPHTQLRALLSTIFFALLGGLFQRWSCAKAKMILSKQRENERLLMAYERLLSQTLTFPASREIISSGQYRSRKRTVVVIACDIVDYSIWSREIHSPERITSILSTFFQLFDQHCFNCPDVRIEPLRSQGDSRIAIAGLWEPVELPDFANQIEGPESIEIAAVAAVQAMLDFTDSIRNGILHERLRDRNLPDPDLRARVGIHLGDVNKGVICTQVDTTAREEGRMWFDVWGDVVNVAARFEGKAPPNGVLISSKVLNAVGNRFEHGGVQEFEVKHGEILKGAVVTKAIVGQGTGRRLIT